MRPTLPLLAAPLVASLLLSAPARAADPLPTRIDLGGGNELAAIGNIAYDWNRFDGDDAFEDRDAIRRRELGLTLKKKGVYDAMVNYDFANDTWLDVFARVETRALFGRDAGRVRVGYMKTPVALEAVTASRATSFMEVALPVQAIYEGRRTGVEWSLERPRHYLQAGAYGGKDLHGNNPGTTQAVRAVWTPLKDKDAARVLHMGLAASMEHPRGWSEDGVHYAARARFRSRPEAGLTDLRLVDSGTLLQAERIDRAGLELIWIHGPLSLQAESLHVRASRGDGLPGFRGDGQYVFASWVVTGESRPYANAGVANLKPDHRAGALELLARYSRVDLDDGAIAGGRQHDWTLGANWYLGTHLKFQANYVRADALRNGVRRRPDIVELRAQLQF